MQLPGLLARLSGQAWPGSMLSSGRDYELAPLPGWGQTKGRTGSKPIRFFIENPGQANLPPANFPGQTAPLSWLCKWAKLLVGPTTTHYLVCPNPSADCCKPSPLLLHYAIPSGQLCRFPYDPCRVSLDLGTPKKWHKVLGSCLSTLASLFSLE